MQMRPLFLSCAGAAVLAAAVASSFGATPPSPPRLAPGDPRNTASPRPPGLANPADSGTPGAAPGSVIFAPDDAVHAAPTLDKNGDFHLFPPYRPAPEDARKEGVPAGTSFRFQMDSADSKFYPGISKNQPGATVPYTRWVYIYVPAEVDKTKPAPFIICQDAMQQGNVPHVLDNMISEKRLPAMVAIFIANGGGDAQGSERGLEYDTVSGKYAEFVEAEVLPRVEKEAGVKLTKDPDARCTMGQSSGAAAAFSMAWFHPDLYHRVISYSGTFVNQQSPEDPKTPHGAWEYHEHLIPGAEKKPIRIWMEVGSVDLRSTDPESTYHNWPLANNRMAAALKAKGYDYQYVFADGAGHVNGQMEAQTLPEAMEWVWKGYKEK